MAIGEFVLVYSQRDIEVAQMKREKKKRKKKRKKKSGSSGNKVEEEEGGEDVQLPSPVQAAAASALAFALGAMVPLLAAAFMKPHKVRLGALAAAVTVALIVFGGAGAKLGKSCLRVLVGGWLAVLVTYGIMKAFEIRRLVIQEMVSSVMFSI